MCLFTLETLQSECLYALGTPRSILTDDFLRVKGSNGSIWALGDAATIDQPKAIEHAEELFVEVRFVTARIRHYGDWIRLGGSAAPQQISAVLDWSLASRGLACCNVIA